MLCTFSESSKIKETNVKIELRTERVLKPSNGQDITSDLRSGVLFPGEQRGGGGGGGITAFRGMKGGGLIAGYLLGPSCSKGG